MKKKWFNDEGHYRSLFKWLRVMKLTLFFLLTALIHVSASVYSQQTKLSVSLQNVTVRDVLRLVEDQSEFFFLYKNDNIDVNRTVNIDIKDKSVEYLLDQLFKGTKVSYEVTNRQIVLVDKEKGDFSFPSQQQKPVSGKVTDSSGSPLPGVSVVIKGTTNGVITDSNGNYKMTNIPENATLRFSFVGMKGQEIAVGGKTTINITLADETIGLDEVVAIGYGSRAKRDITTAISTVESKDIAQVVTMNPVQALQGQMTGVQISGNSGNLMDHPVVRIRGTNTWGVADPLYVVDGIPIQSYGSGIDATEGITSYLAGPLNIMSMIDPNDIESISVLKDASAAAIYGVRAANGVILITTKKGSGDKPKIEFSIRQGIQNISQHLNILNSQQYIKHIQDVYASDPTLAVDPFNKDIIDPNSPKYLGNSTTYDWQNELKNKNAPFKEYSMRLIGGTAKTDYFLSLGYTNQEGTLLGNNLKRYNASFKLNSEITKWMRTGVNYRISSISGYDALSRLDIYYSKLAGAPPVQPILDPSGPYGYVQTVVGYQPDGTFNSDALFGAGTQYNYKAIIALNDYSHSALRNMGNAYFELEPIQNLKLRGTVSVDANMRYGSFFGSYDEPLFNNHYGDPRSKGGGNSAGRLEEIEVRDFNLVKELSLSYKNSFGDHNFDFLLNAMDQKVNAKSIDNVSEYMSTANPDLRFMPSSKYTMTESYLSRSALVGMMGRIGYNFKTKYYLDMTVRRDGSSRFAPDKRWGVFPAVSMAWRVSSEPFMKKFNWLTDMKIRAGWGQLGNQEVRNLAYLSPISTNSVTSWGTTADGRGNLINGANINGIPSPNLQWERTSTSNIGIDAVVKNKLNFSVEYYNKLTSGILQEMTIPLSMGIKENPVANIASVRNSGFELSLNYNNSVGEFNYSIGGNFSTVKNRVVETYNHIPLWNIEEGQSMFYIKGYKVGGIFQTQPEVDAWKAKYSDESYQTAKVAPGDVYFQDLRSASTKPGEFYSNTKDNIINSYDMVNLGKTIPGFYYGLNMSLEWRGIDLSAQFTGVGDVVKYNDIRATLEYSPSVGPNLSTKVLNTWTPENKSTTVPRLMGGDPASNFRMSDMFVENASYLRMANLQVGYTLPKKICDLTHLNMRSLRLYLAASNLFTITKYTGLDPENDRYPMPRIFTMGLNVSF
jgi:TonB-linked SusC/RagA family outer membrane protein